MRPPVYAVRVRTNHPKPSWRFVRAESAAQAQALAAAWEWPVLEVLPEPLTAEEAWQIGARALPRSDALDPPAEQAAPLPS
jgi:hypothetical protein